MIPTNKKLILINNNIVKQVKSKVSVWPSSYATGKVNKEYKKLYNNNNKRKNAMGDVNNEGYYKKGSSNSLFLTPGIRNCLSLVYGEKIIKDPFRFGKERKKFEMNFSQSIKKMVSDTSSKKKTIPNNVNIIRWYKNN